MKKTGNERQTWKREGKVCESEVKEGKDSQKGPSPYITPLFFWGGGSRRRAHLSNVDIKYK